MMPVHMAINTDMKSLVSYIVKIANCSKKEVNI